MDWNQTVIPVGKGDEGFDVSPDGRELWTADAEDGTLSVIDLATRKVAATLFDLRRANGSQGVKLDVSAIDALRWNDLYRVMFAKGNHGDFTEWGMLAWKLAIPMPPNPEGHTREIGHKIDLQVCLSILALLDAQLRGQKQSFDELQQSLQHQAGVEFSHPIEAGRPASKQAPISGEL